MIFDPACEEPMPRYIEITDFSDPALDAYVRLTGAQQRRRLEPEKGIFIAESPTVIEVAIGAGCMPLSLLTERRLINESAERVIALAEEKNPGLPVYTAEHDLLEKMTGFPLTRGVLAEMRRPAPREVEDLCRGASRIAVLEGVVDSTNIGAIFRSAAGLGMDAVLLTPTCCDPLCRRAVRVSMGTVLQVPWGYIAPTPEAWAEHGIDILHDLGFSTAAMALSDDSVSLDDPALNGEERLAILLGTEGDGLSHRTIAKCDYTVRIPMQHGVDSLNVAAASAVAFWQLRKK